MNRQIILNQIKTPDGTILTSRFRHDYKEHTDSNGELYLVDGGVDYLRRSRNVIPYEEQTVYSDSSFEIIRKVFMWGSRINSTIVWEPLEEMTSEHLRNILKTQHISDMVQDLLHRELNFKEMIDRNSNVI